MELQDKLKLLQARQKELEAKKDKMIRIAGMEERKLEEALDRLRDLDVPNPEELTLTELETMAEEINSELGEDLDLLEEEMKTGEALLAQYSQL